MIMSALQVYSTQLEDGHSVTGLPLHVLHFAADDLLSSSCAIQEPSKTYEEVHSRP
jgi:hypothetical protein